MTVNIVRLYGLQKKNVLQLPLSPEMPFVDLTHIVKYNVQSSHCVPVIPSLMIPDGGRGLPLHSPRSA